MIGPEIEKYVKDFISEPTRKAQNLAMATAGTCLVLQFGFVAIEKISAGGFDLKPAGKSLIVVLAATSFFFLARFVLSYLRDIRIRDHMRASASMAVSAELESIEKAHSIDLTDKVAGDRNPYLPGYNQLLKITTQSQERMLIFDKISLFIDILIPVALCAAIVIAFLFGFPRAG